MKIYIQINVISVKLLTFIKYLDLNDIPHYLFKSTNDYEKNETKTTDH